MNAATHSSAITEAWMPEEMASSASDGPTSNWVFTMSGRSSGLFRTFARLKASRSVK
jgi:hypothetical protein